MYRPNFLSESTASAITATRLTRVIVLCIKKLILVAIRSDKLPPHELAAARPLARVLALLTLIGHNRRARRMATA